MNIKKILGMIGMLALCAVGCDNDASSVGGGGGKPGGSGIDDNSGDHGDNQTKERTLGESCSEEFVCAAPLECNEENICIAVGEEGVDCDEKITFCRKNLKCHNGKCRVPVGSGEACGDDKPCSGKLYCIDGVCKNGLPVGSDCDDTKHFCDDSLGKCWEGKCTAYMRPGDACGIFDGDLLCERNTEEYRYYCLSGVCKAFGKEGAACGNDKPCLSPLECGKNNVCTKVSNSGEACGEGIPCAKPLVCDAGKCGDPRPHGTSCDGNDSVCGEGAFCNSDDVCAPIGPECEKDKENCPGDNYCCLDADSCKGHLNRCVPYTKDHANTESCVYKTTAGLFDAAIQCEWIPGKNETELSVKVEMPPLVGKFGNNEGLSTVVAFWSYEMDSTKEIHRKNTVFRFMNPKTCETLETVTVEGYFERRWHHMPVAVDTNGDGLSEIFALGRSEQTYKSNLVKIAWNKNKHEAKIIARDIESPIMLSAAELDASIKGPEIVDSSGRVFRSVDDGEHKAGELIAGSDKLGGRAQAPALADFDHDGNFETVTNRKFATWDKNKKGWKVLLNLKGIHGSYPALADFGTPGDTADEFDYNTFDGIPEVVFSGGSRNKDGMVDVGQLLLFALKKKSDGQYEMQILMDVDKFSIGGPPTIADFDNDGRPEIAVASRYFYGVYDPLCKVGKDGNYDKTMQEECLGSYCVQGMPDGKMRHINGKTILTPVVCTEEQIQTRAMAKRNYVKWEVLTQDYSSGATGSSVFDFDGDGQDEAVYADECFTRVYDGKSGEVLFSSMRTSGTSQEAPVIADIDDDGSTEILMGSDYTQHCNQAGQSSLEHVKNVTIEKQIIGNDGKPKIEKQIIKNVGADKIHRGMKCVTDEDCQQEMPCLEGLCRCTEDKQCFTKKWSLKAGATDIFVQNICVPPLPKDELNETKYPKDTFKARDVCRAAREIHGKSIPGLVVLKDRYDRWASARKIWTQHGYSVAAFADNGSTHDAAQWLKKFKTIGKVKVGKSLVDRRINNTYRKNAFGEYAADTAPDVTVSLDHNACRTQGDGKDVILTGKICNRGTKPIPQALPTIFYVLDNNDEVVNKCQHMSEQGFGVGTCRNIECNIGKAGDLKGMKIRVVGNETLEGDRLIVECNGSNNTVTTVIQSCPLIIN